MVQSFFHVALQLLKKKNFLTKSARNGKKKSRYSIFFFSQIVEIFFREICGKRFQVNQQYYFTLTFDQYRAEILRWTTLTTLLGHRVGMCVWVMRRILIIIPRGKDIYFCTSNMTLFPVRKIISITHYVHK